MVYCAREPAPLHATLRRPHPLVIGMDLLGSFEVVIIDYHTHQLQLSLLRTACAERLVEDPLACS